MSEVNKKSTTTKKKSTNTKTTKQTTKKKSTAKKQVKKTPKKQTTRTRKIDTILENKTYQNAEKLYKNKDYENAYNEYIKLSSEFPKNKKVYKRLLECLTQDYTYKEKSKEFTRTFNDYITTYKILATERELKYLEKKLDEYKEVKEKAKSKFLLIALTGYFGVHKFIEKKYIIGFIYLFTLGIFGLGVIYDLITDYAEFEDDRQLDIVRYLVSIVIVIFALINCKTTNFFYFIIAAILFSPIVFSKLLRYIPNIIKLIAIIILCYFGFKTTTVIEFIPTNLIGTWETTNENTNFKSLKIKSDKTIISFNDRENETGLNEYDSDTKIFKVYMNATKFYKFKLDKNKEKLCIYNESDSCLISFEKK